MTNDPITEAAQRAWVKHFTAQGMPEGRSVKEFGAAYGTYDLQTWLMALTAREALRPIREMVQDQRLFGRGQNSQEWWDGVQYILEELDPLIYAKDCPCGGFGGDSCPQMESIGEAARPSYAPFAPADPKSCTCVDPFSDCPTHG